MNSNNNKSGRYPRPQSSPTTIAETPASRVSKQLILNLRGDDELNIRSAFRKLAEGEGWSVEEFTGFDEQHGQMVTRQTYTRNFDDDRSGEIAITKLREALAELSTVAILMSPAWVSP